MNTSQLNESATPGDAIGAEIIKVSAQQAAEYGKKLTKVSDQLDLIKTKLGVVGQETTVAKAYIEMVRKTSAHFTQEALRREAKLKDGDIIALQGLALEEMVRNEELNAAKVGTTENVNQVLQIPPSLH